MKKDLREHRDAIIEAITHMVDQSILVAEERSGLSQLINKIDVKLELQSAVLTVSAGHVLDLRKDFVAELKEPQGHLKLT